MAEVASVKGGAINLERRVKRLSHIMSKKVKILDTMDLPVL